jgi:hypothetical protein
MGQYPRHCDTRLQGPRWQRALCLGLLVAVGVIFHKRFQVNRGLAALRQAYRDRRPVQSRITAFDYTPFASETGSMDQNEPAKGPQGDLNRAERILLDAAQDWPGPGSEQALGVLYLAQNRLDDAVTHIKIAAKASEWVWVSPVVCGATSASRRSARDTDGRKSGGDWVKPSHHSHSHDFVSPYSIEDCCRGQLRGAIHSEHARGS